MGSNPGEGFFFYYFFLLSLILHQKPIGKHIRPGHFSLFPVFSKLFMENMNILWILAKVSKIWRNDLLCFTFHFYFRIWLNREKKKKKIPLWGLNPRLHGNCYWKATLYPTSPSGGQIDVKKGKKVQFRAKAINENIEKRVRQFQNPLHANKKSTCS